MWAYFYEDNREEVKTKLSEPFVLMAEGPEASSETTGDVSNTKKVFIPQETLDHPLDVTLVAEDGEEFKAHRDVLSEASPFFKKLLNSDMRESNEGVVRLEMLTELGLRDILEFIYTGYVQISAEEHAQELIWMADYLFLPHLKTVAGKVLVEKLNASNSISTYNTAQRYRCEELISASKQFIFGNFTAVAKTEDFLNLSSKEVKMWIASDEINVSAEDDVFKIILTWIDRDEIERKDHFAELFQEVRLVYVSREFLNSDVMTNDPVNDNEGCKDLVKDALRVMRLIDSEDYHNISVKPRKSLETTVIVVKMINGGRRGARYQILCYYPHEDTWSRFPGRWPHSSANTEELRHFLSCNGKLYSISNQYDTNSRYDPFSNIWKMLPGENQMKLRKLFIRNDDIFALVSRSCSICVSLRSRGTLYTVHNRHCEEKHLSFIAKYKPESNSWEEISSEIDLGSRVGICVIAKDNFVYFLGGYAQDSRKNLTNADRYDLRTNTWNKIADLQEARYNAYGAIVCGKIYIAGGCQCNDSNFQDCEVYNETTNEWQFTAKVRLVNNGLFAFDILPSNCVTGACADGRLFVLKNYIDIKERRERMIHCYDPDKNEWKVKTLIPRGMAWFRYFHMICCSMTVFKGSKFFQQASLLVDRYGNPLGP